MTVPMEFRLKTNKFFPDASTGTHRFELDEDDKKL